MPVHDATNAATRWYSTPLGRYLLELEQPYFDQAVADVFGYHALQLGLPGLDLLRASRIPFRLGVDAGDGAGLRADFRDLPVASNSTDLVVLPHVLEFSANPHQVLRETARVLLPEAQVVIACFNPWSLWGFRRAFTRNGSYPWHGRFLNLPRVKDWLALLGLEITAGSMKCYVPPCAAEKWLPGLALMAAPGGRWGPVAGGGSFLQAGERGGGRGGGKGGGGRPKEGAG